MSIAVFDYLKCIGENAETETNCYKHPCFLSSDLVSIETGDYPVPKPQSGSYSYSFEIRIRMKATTLPDNKCENFEIWVEWENPPRDGLTVFAGNDSGSHTPTDNQSSYATHDLYDDHNGQSNGLTWDSTTEITSGGGSNQKTITLVLQARIDNTVIQGDVPTMHICIGYDEY